MLRNPVRIILIFLFLFALYVAYKVFFEDRSILSRHTNKIEDLSDELKGIEAELNAYGENNYDKDFLYIVSPSFGDEFNILLERRFIKRRELSSAYKDYGDYFLNELYRLDSDAPPEYRNLALNVSGEDFKSNVKRDTDKGKRLFDFMLGTRKKALEAYDNSCLVTSDFTSKYYRLKSSISPFVYPLSLEFIFVEGDSLNKRLLEGGGHLGNSLLPKYLLKYISPSLHYKKGKAYRQIANLFFLKGDYVNVKKYILYSEREYLLTLLLDKSFANVYYDLSELYVFSFKHLPMKNAIYYLRKSEFLLNEVLSRGFLSSSASNKRVLFLLGETYYLLSSLSFSDKKRLMKLYSSDYNGVSLRGFRFYYLNRARSVYRDKLLIMLKEGSPSYKNAFKNYLRIEEELGSGL